jgi:hypothetical protein
MAYKPGDLVLESGIYKVTHDPKHAEVHEVTCIEGKKFPTCNSCGAHPRFVLAKGAIHVTEQRSFKR